MKSILTIFRMSLVVVMLVVVILDSFPAGLCSAFNQVDVTNWKRTQNPARCHPVRVFVPGRINQHSPERFSGSPEFHSLPGERGPGAVLPCPERQLGLRTHCECVSRDRETQDSFPLRCRRL